MWFLSDFVAKILPALAKQLPDEKFKLVRPRTVQAPLRATFLLVSLCGGGCHPCTTLVPPLYRLVPACRSRCGSSTSRSFLTCSCCTCRYARGWCAHRVRSFASVPPSRSLLWQAGPVPAGQRRMTTLARTRTHAHARTHTDRHAHTHTPTRARARTQVRMESSFSKQTQLSDVLTSRAGQLINGVLLACARLHPPASHSLLHPRTHTHTHARTHARARALSSRRACRAVQCVGARRMLRVGRCMLYAGFKSRCSSSRRCFCI